MNMTKQRYSFLTLCLFILWGAINLEAADDASTPPSDPQAQSEVELLRNQIALQQQQIELLKSTLEKQQKQIDQISKTESASAAAQQPVPLTGYTNPATETVEVASLSPQLPSMRAAPVRGSLIAPLPPTITQVPAPAPNVITPLVAQPPKIVSASQEHEHAEIRQPKHWYEKYSIRGYVQVRHNRLVQTNDNLVCDQCDSSTANNNNFIFRRARMVFSGDVTDKISIYFQPDFAVTNGNRNFAQLRDLYADIAVDAKKEHRFRVGQSKIPFSFENLQSSQNRIPLDRSDPTNSSFANERDIGVFYYYAPVHIRARFKELVTSGLKGSGDYGMFGVGTFNGQILNMQELNNDLHYAYRATYPWKLKNGQFIETSLAAYHGYYTVGSRSTATRCVEADCRYLEWRGIASLIVYPQPFGLQMEYNFGQGPEYNRVTRFIDSNSLSGGYIMATYMKHWKDMTFTPFYRFANYAGGKKQELDARHTIVRDHEFGLEYQMNEFLEFTLQGAKGYRIFEDGARPNNAQSGYQLRLQIQVNY